MGWPSPASTCQPQHLPGSRVGEQQAVLLVGHQHRVGRGCQDGCQALAADLGVREQAGIGRRQGCLPGQGGQEAHLLFGEQVRLVVGQPQGAVIQVFVAQGNARSALGRGTSAGKIEHPRPVQVGEHHALLLAGERQDLLVQVAVQRRWPAPGQS